MILQCFPMGVRNTTSVLGGRSAKGQRAHFIGSESSLAEGSQFGPVSSICPPANVSRKELLIRGESEGRNGSLKHNTNYLTQ